MKEFVAQPLRRSQKDYSLSFKLQIVEEIRSGILSKSQAMRKYGIQGDGTISRWIQKYGILDVCNVSTSKVMKTPEQKIQELEQKLRLLERQNRFLEEELIKSEDKAAILDKLVDLAEAEYLIPVRKNSFPDQSELSAKKTKKR